MAAAAAIGPDAYRERHGIAVAVVRGSGGESDGAGQPRSGGGGGGGAPGSAAAAAARRWAPVQTFAAAPFHAKLLQELRHANFGAPTPVQAQCWPIACGGHDVVAIAKTGSGKTLGYLLPVFHRFLAGAAPPAAPGGSPFAVVLAPTRELVLQIHEQAARFGHTAGVTSTCVYGGAGAPRHSQLPALLAGPRVVIGTPGRLVDFMTEAASPTQPKPALSVQHTQVLVLDEADRMLGCASPTTSGRWCAGSRPTARRCCSPPRGPSPSASSQRSCSAAHRRRTGRCGHHARWIRSGRRLHAVLGGGWAMASAGTRCDCGRLGPHCWSHAHVPRDEHEQ